MNGTKIQAIVEKETAEARKNKMIVLSMALLPIVFVALLLGTDYFILRSDGSDLDSDDLGIIPRQLEDMDPQHAFVIVMNDQYLLYFMLIPMVLPIYIAAYSIIGEKETKSLEPLLATPITVSELLIGKSFAAVAPAVIVTWLSYAVLVLLGYIFLPPPVFQGLIRPVWIIGMVLLVPLFALLSVVAGIIASSRMNDPRAAQQVSALFIIPIVGLSIAVMAGKIFVSVQMVMLAAAVTLAVDVIVLYVTVKIFQRETILTRWK